MGASDDRAELGPTIVDSEAETSRTPRVSGRWSLTGYDLGDLLGRGGMGEVLVAHDQRIDREVAIKRMRQDQPSALAVTRFLREARIQARLDHPAIVPVHELGYDADQRPYFTMKRVTGVTLAERITARGPIQPMLRALTEVCFAIDLAHSKGIIHRDLKPSNIMLGDYNEVYVLDWGVARVLDTERTSAVDLEAKADSSHTETGALLGTPGYMAPEQMRGDDVAPPSDVYALGAILFEVLAGEPLHAPGQRAIASTLTASAASPAERQPERMVAPELDVLCVEALAEDPAARPTARQVAERIQRYLDGDRDLERRRALAHEQVFAAHAALTAGDRAAAVHAAGRALALDPESEYAAALVARLIVEPPDPLPAELLAAVDDEERMLMRVRARRGAGVLLATLAIVLFLPWVYVASWLDLALLLASVVAMVALSLLNARSGAVKLRYVVVGMFALVFTFSRLHAPFVMLPTLVTGLVLALSARPLVIDRPWLLYAFATVAMAVPFALEYLGVFAPTWKMTADGLLTWGRIFGSHGDIELAMLLLGNLGLTLLLTSYAIVITRGRRNAQRRTQIQAWHLRHLLPKTTLKP